jgi:hypothetical protein
LDIRLTDTAIIHTAAIIHMATTGRIRITATILGRTTGPTDTVITATIGIITTNVAINVM